MIVDFLSSKACMTSNFARSAFCYAIYFCSIDFLNSTPKSKLTIETSSNIILKSFNLFLIPYLILIETYSLYTNKLEALYCATIDFNTSFTMDGKTL
jgi:hypothetical protein